ncbi:DNA replication complex GINS protein psf2 [Cordyceps fumosorosea ARSEF 2679]|uniref:DNA replication complex GINS protein PSF2 n=1 Tax=Cordyceps fumosorosea (strain ARSEF 2679) TaxID=1081104 RepID=A0A167TPK2_CORFA|nr:DNA replication complex GINS protein psf2 [Cordyceps fumosorosea ARSEF 2679]OAA60814.1 DNA replication complex GINS protein psf2 [Cordyceps fumosorosea ARSEF 2679]
MASSAKNRLRLPTGVVPRTSYDKLSGAGASEKPASQISQGSYWMRFMDTGKKRHVKCDEVKPSCNRCLKWSGVCGGYETPCRKIPSTKSSSATHLGARCKSLRPSESPEIPTLDESVATLSVTSNEPATPPMSNSYSPYYHPFDYFNGRERTFSSSGSSLGGTPLPAFHGRDPAAMDSFVEAGILDATFWTDTVPRLVQENLAVRYANMAVHILIISKQKPQPIPQEQPGFGSDSYSLALAHYGLAIQQMRNPEEGTCGGTRAAVLCSMLFAVFEALNGDREAAEAHLLCGQRMLDELRQRLPQGIAAGAGSSSLRGELRNLLRYISLQVRIGGATCWKGELDAVCAEYLDEFVAGGDLYDASPGYEMPPDYASREGQFLASDQPSSPPSYNFNITPAEPGKMALPLPNALVPNEVAFLCEMELVTVVPRQRLDSIELLGPLLREQGTTPSLRPPRRSELPLWLALLLKKQRRANIVAPAWLHPASLRDIVHHETTIDTAGWAPPPPPPVRADSTGNARPLNDPDSTTPLSPPFLPSCTADAPSGAIPYHWRELAEMLLTHAHDDVPSAAEVRSLLRDLQEVRDAKMRESTARLEAGIDGVMSLRGVGAMELAESRGFLTAVVEGVRKLGASAEATRREEEEEAGGADDDYDGSDDDDMGL